MRKSYILYIVVIIVSILSLLYIIDNNVFALSYSSNVGVGFTFNPTLSISLSSSDLVIDNLVPGSTKDSNVINVSVATNAAYGYTLSANTNNGNLTHSDSNVDSVFSSIATDADLASLNNSEDNNIWGYTSKLNSEESWNNYNGLSSSSSTVLLDTNTNSSNSNVEDNSNSNGNGIDFKIAAKASSTQPSGTYTGTITFTAITKPTPMNLAESYFAAGKSRYKGYYTMQDMTTEICTNTEVIGEGSQTQLIDIRDDKVYWATKLADGHCWMTQNLDLDLDSNTTYTHWDTDLGWTVPEEAANWKPDNSTSSGTTVPVWQNFINRPYSNDPGNIYYYTSSSEDSDIKYNSLQECTDVGHDNCTHYHVGNYYNWPATIASNNASNLTSQYINAPNSICPAGWKMPNVSTESPYSTFLQLLYEEKITNAQGAYINNGFKNIRSNPLYLIRSGYLIGNDTNSSLTNDTISGTYMTATTYNDSHVYVLSITKNYVDTKASVYRGYRYSVRCVAR